MRIKYPKTYKLIFNIIILQCVLTFNLEAQEKNKLGAVSSSQFIGTESINKNQKGSKSQYHNSSSKTSGNPIIRRTTESMFQIIRLEFNGIEGSLVRRELLLGFSETTTDDYDYGYDAQVIETYENDLNLDLNGMNMSIQAYAALVPEKKVKLKHYSSGENTFSIKITELENIDESQPILIRDNVTDSYFDLSNGEAYQFISQSGSFNDRFELVFQSESESKSLSVNETQYSTKNMYYNTKTNKFYAKQLNNKVKKMMLVNMYGQKILEYKNVSKSKLAEGISFKNVAANTYAIILQTDTNSILTKKIIVK